MERSCSLLYATWGWSAIAKSHCLDVLRLALWFAWPTASTWNNTQFGQYSYFMSADDQLWLLTQGIFIEHHLSNFQPPSLKPRWLEIERCPVSNILWLNALKPVIVAQIENYKWNDCSINNADKTRIIVSRLLRPNQKIESKRPAYFNASSTHPHFLLQKSALVITAYRFRSWQAGRNLDIKVWLTQTAGKRSHATCKSSNCLLDVTQAFLQATEPSTKKIFLPWSRLSFGHVPSISVLVSSIWTTCLGYLQLMCLRRVFKGSWVRYLSS